MEKTELRAKTGRKKKREKDKDRAWRKKTGKNRDNDKL